MIKKFTVDSLNTVIIGIAKLILILMISIVSARILGPQKKGIYVILFIIPNILVLIFNAGISQAIIYFKGRERMDDMIIFNKSLPLMLILSTLSMITGILIFHLFKPSFFSHIPIFMFYFVILSVPVRLFIVFLQSFIYSQENFKTINILQIFIELILFILVLGLFIFPYVFYLLIVTLFVYFLNLLILTIIVIIKQKIKIFPIFDYFFIKKFLKYGISVNLTTIITFLHYKIDLVLINIFASPISVGWYSLASNIGEKVWVFSSSISSVVYPRLANISDKEKNYITPMITRVVFFVTAIVICILFLLSDKFVILLYGNLFIESIIPLKILLVGIFMMSFSHILSNDIALRGMPHVTFSCKLFSLILNIVLNIYLIPILGIMGAAIATFISYTINSITILIAYSVLTKNNISDILIIKYTDFSKVIGSFRNKV